MPHYFFLLGKVFSKGDNQAQKALNLQDYFAYFVKNDYLCTRIYLTPNSRSMTIVFDSSRLAELYFKGNTMLEDGHSEKVAESYVDVVNGLNFSESINKFNSDSNISLNHISDSDTIVSWMISQCKCNLRIRLERTCSFPETYDCHIADFSTVSM